MAIYQVCKSVMTGAAIFSVAIGTASCSNPPNADKTSPSAAAAEAAGVAPNAHSGHSGHDKHSEAAPKGVSTNHDIYHTKTLEVPAGKPVPAITVRVDPDPERGWNLYVGTADFTFAPEKVGSESSPSEGHGHLYINEKPMQRIYSNWTHLPELPPGKNTLRVTLNANGHETLTTQNVPIQESTMVEVYDPKAAQQ